MSGLQWTLLFGLAGLVLLAWWLLRAPSKLTIGERGIFVRQLGLGWIRWEEIEGAYPPGRRDTQSLLLRLRLSERLSRRLRRHHPQLEPPPRTGETFNLRVDLRSAALSPLELLQEIVRRGEGPQPYQR